MSIDDGRIPSNRTLQYVAASTPENEDFNRILLIVHGNETPVDVTLPAIDGRDLVRVAVVERRRGAERGTPSNSSRATIVPLAGTSMHLFRAE